MSSSSSFLSKKIKRNRLERQLSRKSAREEKGFDFRPSICVIYRGKWGGRRAREREDDGRFVKRTHLPGRRSGTIKLYLDLAKGPFTISPAARPRGADISLEIIVYCVSRRGPLSLPSSSFDIDLSLSSSSSLSITFPR